jgi:Domain of unknown function (DUF5664)
MSLPTDRDARNALPIWDGLMMYFPDVWAEVAKVSLLGNKQHNLGARLFWNRDVSTDHLNKVMRHCLDHGTGNVLDTDGTFHMAKAVWRACAELQLAIESQRKPALGQQHPGMGSAGLPAANRTYTQQYPANRCEHYWRRRENRCRLAENHDGEHCFELVNGYAPYLSPIDPRHD